MPAVANFFPKTFIIELPCPPADPEHPREAADVNGSLARKRLRKRESTHTTIQCSGQFSVNFERCAHPATSCGSGDEHHVDGNHPRPGALLVDPHRESALQSARAAREWIRRVPVGVKQPHLIHAVVGGSDTKC